LPDLLAAAQDARLAQLKAQFEQLADYFADEHRLPFVIERVKQRLEEIRRLQRENDWLKTAEYLLSPEEWGHDALDVIGFIPVIGEIADGINALWYAAEGDYTNAALSGAAIIPVVGDIGGKGFRQGKKLLKGAKALDKANDARRLYRRATSTKEAAENLVRSTRKLDDAPALARNASKTDDVFDGTTNQFRVLNECFSRETPVATPAGPKAIGEIEPGELVFAHDFETGRWLPRRVLERHDSLYNGPLVAITTDGGTIQTTLYHPFWVLRGSDLHERPTPRELADHEDQGLSLQGRWVNSHELRAGDVLIGRDGSPQIVLHIAQQYEELYPVSNLTIEENHTFAVGPDAILVHNTAGCPRAGIAGTTPTDRLKEQLFERPGKPKSATTLDAARRELAGESTGFNHVEKVKNAQTGLANRIRRIKNELANPNLTTAERAALERELSEASRLLDFSKRFVPR